MLNGHDFLALGNIHHTDTLGDPALFGDVTHLDSDHFTLVGNYHHAVARMHLAR